MKKKKKTAVSATKSAAAPMIPIEVMLQSLLQKRVGYGRRMVLELALLDVRPGRTGEFEVAFGEARSIIASMPGFVALELQRCVEVPDRYVLLVRWERLEDHVEGFRGSPEYERWRALLHHFYDPFPTVEHYEPVVAIS